MLPSLAQIASSAAASQRAIGRAVEREAFNVSIACYKNFLIGQGHLRVFSGKTPEIDGKAA